MIPRAPVSEILTQVKALVFAYGASLRIVS